jgi:transposase
MHNDARIVVDLAKAVFRIAVSDRPGHVPLQRLCPRNQFLDFFAQHPVATVLLQACGSAHFGS